MIQQTAVIYVRKSNEEAEGRSIRQQREALEARSEREGWEVLAVIEEVQSAYADRERPRFTEAMALAEEHGAILLVWALDRFSRRGAEDVLRLFPRGGKAAPFRLVGEDGTDTADPARRLETILRAEIALQESERIGGRIRRARADARSKGLWASGNAPYGFAVEGLGDERRLVIVPERAAVVRRMGDEVKSGAAYRAVARGLNDDGIDPPNTKRKNGVPLWHPTTIQAILTNPATAGYLPRGTRAASSVQVRVQSYLKDPSGAPIRASWGALIEPAEWAVIVGVIVANARTGKIKGTASDGDAQPTLLGQVLKCSACGRTMAARRHTSKDGVRRIQYVCGSPNPVSGLRHVSGEGNKCDEWVIGVVLRRLAALAADDATDPTVVAVVREWGRLTGADIDAPERTTTESRIIELEEGRERTARMLRDGLIPEALGAEMLQETATALADARALMASLPSNTPGTAVLGWLADLAQLGEDGNPFDVWDTLTPATQRSIIGAVIQTVTLGPGKIGGRYSVSEWAARFTFEWTS